MSDLERDVLLKKIAALEAELEDLKPSGQVAEDVRALELTIDAACEDPAFEAKFGAADRDALSRLAAKAQERDEALKQAKLAWERHAEKDRAYSEALAQRDAAREERDAALADNAALAEALEIATRGRAVRDQGNAPGHAHAIPGIWDNDNGGRSGTACEWCRIEWPKVQRAQHTTHPGAALLEELETLRQQRALFDEAASALYGYTEFIGPCAHGRDPWDRCDTCGEGTSVAAAQKVIVKMAEEHRKALVRARNEGVEKAAQKAREIGRTFREEAAARPGPIGDAWLMAASGAADIANAIDAKKEPES